MLASIAVVVGALYLAKGVLVPLTLAVLLSFLLSPVCDWLERNRFGRIPAVLATATLAFALLGILAWIAVVQLSDLAPRMPDYQNNIQAKLLSVNSYVSVALSKVTKTAQNLGQSLPQPEQSGSRQGTSEWPYTVRVITAPTSPLQVLGGMFGTVLGVLGSTGMVIVLVVFFLVRREDLRDRFIRLVGSDQVTVTTQMLEDAGTRVSRYLSMLLLINSAFGISVSLGLYLIGLPNAVLWGILAAALRFIPYIGPWIAAAMPIGLALAVSTGWALPLLTTGLFVVLELIANNVIEPWLYGTRTGVSAVAVLVAAVFWTWLWGVVGLLLATPLTVCLLVIGKHVPQLSFLDILLGNEPVFLPTQRVYQRLVAGDQEGATELVEAYCANRPLVEVYDTMLISALALAETHWHRGELDEGRHTFILQSIKEIIEDRGDRQQEIDGTQNRKEADDNSNPVIAHNPSMRCILCLPSRSEADEIAGMMLSQLVAMQGCLVQIVPAASAARELGDLVLQLHADLVCISALPPAAVMHARRQCKRLRGRFPESHLVVGLWGAQGVLSKAKERIGCSAAVQVVATLADAQQQIRLLMQPIVSEFEIPLPSDSEPTVAEGCSACSVRNE
jgi:predicted PurR-regulated permease PerM